MFVAIGHTPNTLFLEGKLELTEKKYVKWTTPFRSFTSVEGVFAPQEMPVGYINHAAVPLATRIRSFRESAAQVKRLRPQVLEMSAPDLH